MPNQLPHNLYMTGGRKTNKHTNKQKEVSVRVGEQFADGGLENKFISKHNVSMKSLLRCIRLKIRTYVEIGDCIAILFLYTRWEQISLLENISICAFT